MREITLESRWSNHRARLWGSAGSLMISLLCISCGDTSRNASQPEMPRSERQGFLAFTAKHLYIDKLETPVAAPVAVGSNSSPATIESDAPDIVTVDRRGYLVAHRNGNAFVHARGDSSRGFTVEVRSINGLWVTPGVAELKVGEAIPVKIAANDGSLINPEAVTWATSNPSVAMVDRGRIEAGKHAGRARLAATYSGLTAQVLVTVSAPGSNAPSFRTAPRRLPVGSIQRYELTEPPPPGATWSTKNSRILASLGNGFFWAKAIGESSACVEFGTNHACTRVEVVR